MTLDNKMIKVISWLEYLVGSQCYNPNSYDGWNNTEGREFRYPLSIPNSEGRYMKVRGTVTDKCAIYGPPFEIDVTPETIETMRYRFGSNELFIGRGIINVLRYLEWRYGIDFNELESQVPPEKDKR